MGGERVCVCVWESRRESVCGREGLQREKLWGELRGPLAAALRVIDKSEGVM